MARKLKIMKMRNIHLTTSKMTKILKNVKNENCTLKDLELARKLKITENEKHPLDEMKNDEITEKLEK